MTTAMKWIGGTTVLALALIGSALVAGRTLDAQEEAKPVDPNAWLQAGDVLADNADDATAPAEAAQAPVPDATPIPQPVTATDSPFVIKRILPIDGPIKYGEWHWDDKGVPDGPLVITVDLDARVLSVFRDGYEIGAAAVLLGTADHPTPTGTFPILTKERHNVSEKYGNAPMPWTLRLTWDGVAIHGGSQVENGYASHGCIGTPDDFVSKLYAIAKKGDKVIITRGVTAGIGSPLAS